MIGGLALAGATADITDHPPSPRPARGLPPQASGSSLNPQSGGFSSISAAGAQELHSVASGAGNAAARHDGQDLDSEGGSQAGASSSGWEGTHARQDDVFGAVRQPGGAPASHDPAALGQNGAAPAAGMASGAAGIHNSSAAGAAVGSHMAPWSNNGDKGGYSSRGAAAGSAARQDPTGGAALGYQGAPADPSSIAAYRPEGSGHADDGARSEMAAGYGGGSGVEGLGQGGARSTGLDSDESSRRHRNAGERSNLPGGRDGAGRRSNPAGKPVQVKVCFLCYQASWRINGRSQA